MQITFKQYVESKSQLVESLDASPKHTQRYAVSKYCKFPIGEKDDKKYIPLKPKGKVLVEWIYDENDKPAVSKLTLNDTIIETYWSNTKIYNWILNNTQPL